MASANIAKLTATTVQALDQLISLREAELDNLKQARENLAGFEVENNGEVAAEVKEAIKPKRSRRSSTKAKASDDGGETKTDKIRSLTDDGWSAKEIADELNTNISFVYNVRRGKK